MKLRIILYTLALTGLLWAGSGCRQFVEDHEVSPNAPLSVTPELLLPAAETYVFNVYNSNAARIVAIFMQSQAGLDRQYASHNRYLVNETDIDSDWQNAYEGALMDLKTLIEMAEGQNKPVYAGIARTLRAMTLGVLTDCWGDIPYSEALQGRDRANPRFDSQQEIYRTIQSELDLAIESLNAEIPEGALGQLPGRQDLIHGGDVNKWLITAWTLKARYHNHLSKIDPQGSAQLAMEAVDEALALNPSAADDALAKYGADLTNANPWALFAEQRFGDLGMGAFMVDTMLNSFDPRIYDYVFANAGGNFKGYYPGEGTTNPDSISTIGLRFSDYSSPLTMVSFAELKFIEAEAKLRLGNAEGAAEAYNTAVEASVNSYNVDPDEATQYLADMNRDAESITLADVMFQKYVALYTQIEVWTDWRRTGFPQLAYPYNLTESSFPRSFPTPQSESQRNPNSPNVRSVTNRVWWDR